MQAFVCHLCSAVCEGLVALGKILIWCGFSAGQNFIHHLHNVNKMNADERVCLFNLCSHLTDID